MFNRIDRFTKRDITGQFDNLQEIIEYIKNPDREELSKIFKMREIAVGIEEYKKVPEYKRLKSMLPCFVTNFIFNDYIANKASILSPTGYLYLDIDNVDTFDFNKTYVCAYWKSVSGRGYGMMVKVEGLTPENLKTVAYEISKALSIPFDKAAISYDRNNVLSFDPDAYFYDNVEVFNAIDLIPEIVVNDNVKNSYYNVNKDLKPSLDCNRRKIRFSNLNERTAHLKLDYDVNGVVDMKKNKIPYTQLFLPSFIRKGSRGRILSAFAIGFLSLNPLIGLGDFRKYMWQFNKERCFPPIEYKKLEFMLDGIFGRKDNYKVQENASRRFFYTSEKKWERYEKNSINMKYMNEDRKTASYQKVEKAMISLYEEDKRYWKTDIAKSIPMHPDTVAKYYDKAKLELQKVMACDYFIGKLYNSQYFAPYYRMKRDVVMLSIIYKSQKEMQGRLITNYLFKKTNLNKNEILTTKHVITTPIGVFLVGLNQNSTQTISINKQSIYEPYFTNILPL